MSVETMVAIIERDAQEEATRLLLDAEAEAAGIVADAEARVARHVTDALARVAPALRGEATRRVNAARLHRLERRAAIVSEQVAAVFAAAEARVSAIAGGEDPARWRAAIRGLATSSLDGIDGGRLAIRDRDAAQVEDIVAGAGAVLERLPGDAPAGVRVQASDGRFEVDATLPVRVNRARRRLAEVVVAVLGLGPGEYP